MSGLCPDADCFNADFIVLLCSSCIYSFIEKRMRPADRVAIHEAMEQQSEFVSIAISRFSL